jgi:NitT/TauT family transport system substrate-binding protein
LALLALALLAAGCAKTVDPLPGGVTVSGSVSGSASAASSSPINMGALKGPTGMALAALIDDPSAPPLELTLAASPDAITPGLIDGSLDMALIPANLAALLHTKTAGGVQVAAVAVLGTLSIVERGDSIHQFTDLAGHSLASTGLGTTPQYVMDFLLGKAGLTDQVTIDYRSEAAEAVAAMTAGQTDLAILPEPYTSALLAADDTLRIALDLTDVWDQLAPESQLVSAVLVATSDFAEQHPDELAAVVEAYRSAVEFTNQQPDQAAIGIVDLGVVADPAIAAAAIPRSHIVALTGQEMRTALDGYLSVLHQANPASVGDVWPITGLYVAD